MLTAFKEEINLGNIRFGQPYDFVYEVENDSNEEIRVQKVVLSCGSCTKASINKQKIEPKGSAMVNATFTPGSTGVQSKKISVVYKDSQEQQKTLDLKFKATVSG